MAKPPQAPAKSSSSQTVVQSQQWTGPLPPPAALEHFDRIIPGGAERILRMAEHEQNHRLEQEQQALKAGIADSTRGQWLGAAIAFAAVVGAVAIVAMHGPWQAAVALVGVPLLGVVQAFIRGRDSNSKE